MSTTWSRSTGLIQWACHISAEKLGFSSQFTFRLESLSYVLSLLRTLLTLYPDLFPGATKAATLRRTASSSLGDAAVMKMMSGRLGVKEKAAIAFEAQSTAASAVNSQFASFLEWRYTAEIGTDGAAGTIGFDATLGGVVFTAALGAVNNDAYIDLATELPPTVAVVQCLVVESKEIWKQGVKGLVTKHASEITQALSAEDMRKDAKRLRITDIDTTAAPSRSPLLKRRLRDLCQVPSFSQSLCDNKTVFML